jgi:hypothetical protein
MLDRITVSVAIGLATGLAFWCLVAFVFWLNTLVPWTWFAFSAVGFTIIAFVIDARTQENE